MDPSLVIHQFHPSVEKQPLNTHYQSYVADSADVSNISWNIDSPFAGALLDNEVFIEYHVGFNYDPGTNMPIADEVFAKMFEGGVDNNNLASDAYPEVSSKLALKQGWAMHGGLSNCEVVLNGQSIRQNPSRYMAEFARFYSHPMEEQGVCSMSGGHLDSGLIMRTRNGIPHLHPARP